ncbi:hypothetical protein N0V82_001890 [Gnomoniopsis sp. IMI 355080]|nr:hypothetical protein N0V82_001890 [Gnomoniopsis sp. IMI 355080]
MAKRSHAEFTDRDGHSIGIVKKAKALDAMDNLSDHADELIECLQALKSQRGKVKDSALTQRLASLSHELLPSIQSIAETDDATNAPSVPKPSVVPVVPILTAWSPSEVAHETPCLPPVLDPVLERESFTHAGSVKNPGERSYEQLEWLGDAYLYLMSTVYIFLTFPHLKHGSMSQLREVLVRNATLKDYSVHYGFDKRIILPEEYGPNGREGGTKASAKERDKLLGDVFEAHVAAIILSDPANGVAKTASWLKALWSTTISQQIKKNTWQGKQAPMIAPTIGSRTACPQPQDPQAQVQSSKGHSSKERLSGDLALHEPRVSIEYRSLDDGRPQKKDPLTKLKLFTQGAFLVGYGETVQLGVGTDKNKKEANEKAAQNALENKKLMNLYREKKRVVQEKKRAAQEDASRGMDF